MLESGWKCLDVLDVNFVDRSNKYSMKEQDCGWGRLCYILLYCKLNVWLPFLPSKFHPYFSMGGSTVGFSPPAYTM